ncbi:MAG TPA: cation transporter [Bacteroidetes bacterium]|nr:cation transporter [Bacteroidota bacterium]
MVSKERVAILSVFANIFLAFFKVIVGLISNSAAVLADGIHSGMDILSSLISFVGIKIAKKPEDEKHPYGHYKFEVLTGLIITILLFIAGAVIIFESIKNHLAKEVLKLGIWTIGVMVISVVLNYIMAKLKIKVGKRENSLSLLSDGVHSMLDVYSSIAVVAGLLLAKVWPIADSILGVLIGAYIIKESFSLAKEGLDSLLDSSAGKEVEKKIKSVVEKENIEVSSLKTQKRGSVISANLEIKLPKNLSVKEVTAISETLKSKLRKEMENLKYIVISVKSHDFSDSYFEPKFGRGFGWQRRGFGMRSSNAMLNNYCVCPNCGYKVEHQRGIPCATLECPQCHTKLVREELQNKGSKQQSNSQV